MANKTMITTSGRDLSKVPFTKEELDNFEKGLMRFNNTSLTRDEFECYYKSLTLTELFTNVDGVKLKNIAFQTLASLYLSVGMLVEELALNDYSLKKMQTMHFDSYLMNDIWNLLFNKSKKNNMILNGVPRYIWVEEVNTIANSSAVFMTDKHELKGLIEALRAFKELGLNEGLEVDAIEALLITLEFTLKELLMFQIEDLNEIISKKGFINKFCQTIAECKKMIIIYACVAGLVYLGAAAFAIPVAGEIWTYSTAVKAAAADTASFSTGLGVLGAILI